MRRIRSSQFREPARQSRNNEASLAVLNVKGRPIRDAPLGTYRKRGKPDDDAFGKCNSQHSITHRRLNCSIGSRDVSCWLHKWKSRDRPTL